MILNKYIKSPINYTGNKYQILNQIIPKIDDKNKIIVDMCSGGATVGINFINAKKVILIEENKKVTTLLEYLGREDFRSICIRTEKILDKYKLSNSYKDGTEFYKRFRKGNIGLKDYNKESFNKLRDDYNKRKDKYTKNAINELYILMLYGFNNELRFNKKGNFNIPCGKTDFNKNNFEKLKEFNNRYSKEKYKIVNIDCFSKQAERIYDKADVIYIDPPYLITLAGYNEGNKWTEKTEKKLLELILKLVNKGKIVYLSNVLESDKKKNELLIEWCKLNERIIKIYNINKHYKSASYNKKIRGENYEVLIEVKNENK